MCNTIIAASDMASGHENNGPGDMLVWVNWPLGCRSTKRGNGGMFGGFQNDEEKHKRGGLSQLIEFRLKDFLHIAFPNFQRLVSITTNHT